MASASAPTLTTPMECWGIILLSPTTSALIMPCWGYESARASVPIISTSTTSSMATVLPPLVMRTIAGPLRQEAAMSTPSHRTPNSSSTPAPVLAITTCNPPVLPSARVPRPGHLPSILMALPDHRQPSISDPLSTPGTRIPHLLPLHHLPRLLHRLSYLLHRLPLHHLSHPHHLPISSKKDNSCFPCCVVK